MKPLAFFLSLCLALPALADIVHLNDGRTIEGTIKRTRDGYVVTDAAGKTTPVPADAVKSIELKKSTGGQSADEMLGSLRRSVANLDDFRQIIARYKTFVAQNAGSPAGKEAAQDLAQWQDKLDKKMVKVGREWVTQERLTALQSQARQAAGRAQPLVTAGKLKEALAVIDPALAVAPASPELLYLKGVILFRQAQFIPARNAFQAAEAQMPDNAAIHNNIGVILWKTRALMPGLLEFDKAMLASPNNQTVLDNVAEARLHALPVESQKSDLTKRVVEHFNAQDTIVQREMAKQGLYRWGSQWLDQKEYAALQQQQKAVKDKLDALESQFNAAQQRLIQIAQTIDNDQQAMNLMQQQAFIVDGKGNVAPLPLPQRYYDLQLDQQQLTVERNTVQRQQVELRRLAAEQKQDLPEPKYTGIQKAFDVEGMPLRPAQSANATAPATAPAASATTRPANGTGGADY